MAKLPLVVKFSTLPTPPELFRQFELGEISREELHATMALHARGLIDEMDAAFADPRTSYLERVRNFVAARKLARAHGTARLREILGCLGAIPDFPPAQILWNASHGDVPLHCFFRMRTEPVFRIVRLEVEAMEVRLAVEYGAHAKRDTTREEIRLRRDATLRLGLAERTPL